MGGEGGGPDIGPWRGLALVQGDVRRRLGRMLESEHGVSLWDYTVLRTLASSPGGRSRMTELARAVDYTPSGLTRLVGRLERAGLVEREPCPDDRRGAVARLTPSGRRLFARARRTHVRGVGELFLDRCTEEELATMSALWERLLPGSTAPVSPGHPPRAG